MGILSMQLVLIVGAMMSPYSVCDILHISVITHVQNGDSPLMAAALTGKTDVVVELLRAGANINLQSKVCHYKMSN